MFTTDFEEEEVKSLCPGLSPAEHVQHAIDCLRSSDSTLQDSHFSFRRWKIMDYSRAYSSHQITPLVVAERLISAVVQSSEPGMDMSFFVSYDARDILTQATESTLRYQRGEPLSVLDGVPIAVKDEINCMPYPTTGGSKWLHKVRPCKEDACCVERLRSCGAILVGKTNMQELSAGTSGINPHYGTSRNPYNPKRISGGSSISCCCMRRITVEVTIPDIEVMRLAHYVTIGSECTASIAHHLEHKGRSESGWDVRVALSIYGSFDSRDYLNAQRIRNRQMRFHEKIFSMADVIVSPMVGVTDYEIMEDAQETGELDYVNGAALVRYSIAGNFLGLPAVTVPFIGKPWSEAKLIQIAYAVEALCEAEYKKPQVFYDLLGEC
ncbi:putative fatty acid amide hydrolase [Helianthus debilis subsp. tardiflorus]